MFTRPRPAFRSTNDQSGACARGFVVNVHALNQLALPDGTPMEMVASLASNEGNEPPEESPDEPLPKKLCQLLLSSYFMFGR